MDLVEKSGGVEEKEFLKSEVHIRMMIKRAKMQTDHRIKISCIILNAALSPYSMRFAAQFIRCVRSLRESMKAREQFRILLGSGTKSRTIIKIAVRIALNAVRSKSSRPSER